MPQLRRSQFLTTYGPGAILEGINGPRIILSPELSEVFSHVKNPNDLFRFEITDQRLSQGQLEGAGILRLPSNAELGMPEKEKLYKTRRFPSWSLCTRHNILYRKTQDDERACPQCSSYKDKWEAWRAASRQAIRFVRACPFGHLDDVDWLKVIHHSQEGCTPAYLLWKGSGALKNITLKCPECKGEGNLGAAYSRSWPCSGRFPEKDNKEEAPYRPGCNQESRIIQRGAANLRIPEIASALVIPKCDTNLHRLLQISVIYDILVARNGLITSKSEFIDTLNRFVERRKLEPEVIHQIERYEEREILKAINHVLNQDIPRNSYEMRRDEFRALLDAAMHGHPPEPPKRPGEVPNFEVSKNHIRSNVCWGPLSFRVTPVSRLRVIIVQHAYRRIPAGQVIATRPVSTIFELPISPGNKWYIGADLSGEGIFLDLDPLSSQQNVPTLNCHAARNWWSAWRNPGAYQGQNWIPTDRHQFHPLFVWWHTLAHRLINALSVDSGYSSAAIRERIFIEIDEASGKAKGGLLLYTAQPGGDGTLGGLIALVPEFERVLERALANVGVCSNDPLCGEETFDVGKYNGSACYACALISETSCEHRNMSLDRNLLIESLNA